MKKFYKTKITLEILSENPIPDHASLSAIIEAADIGDYVAGEDKREQTELTSLQAAEELYKVGSEPEFFGIDSDGNDV